MHVHMYIYMYTYTCIYICIWMEHVICCSYRRDHLQDSLYIDRWFLCHETNFVLKCVRCRSTTVYYPFTRTHVFAMRRNTFLDNLRIACKPESISWKSWKTEELYHNDPMNQKVIVIVYLRKGPHKIVNQVIFRSVDYD